jgi:hypothetical protein
MVQQAAPGQVPAQGGRVQVGEAAMLHGPLTYYVHGLLVCRIWDYVVATDVHRTDKPGRLLLCSVPYRLRVPSALM